MGKKRQKSRLAAGFTIIEISMVMAIVGLIMMLVLRAIPTLQRNSHNTQRKQDVSAILGAISRYQLNNGGNNWPDPPDATAVSSLLKFTKLTQYDLADITLHPGSGGAIAPLTDTNKLDVYNYRHCDINNHGATPQGADFRDVVVLYAVDKGNGTGNAQCQQL